MNAEEFISHSDELLQTFSHAIGAPDKLIELAAHKNNRYLHGIARARKLYQEERVASQSFETSQKQYLEC